MIVDGVELDDEKVGDAVRRCVVVAMTIDKFERNNKRLIRLNSGLQSFIDELKTTLKGEDA